MYNFKSFEFVFFKLILILSKTGYNLQKSYLLGGLNNWDQAFVLILRLKK